MTSPEVRTATDDFVVTWVNDAEAATYWGFDQSHAPLPLTPMAQELVTSWYAQALNMPVRIINGYLFSADDEEEILPLPSEFRGRGGLDLWRSVFEPRIRARLRRLRQMPLDGAGGARAVEAVPQILAESTEAFGDSMYTLPLVFRPAERLLAFCDKHLTDAPSIAGSLVRGFQNLTIARDAALTSLARSARVDASIVAALERGVIPDSAEAAPFRRDLAGFLQTFGRQAISWFDLATPTWEEQPAVVYRLIVARMRETGAAARPSAAQREQAVEEAVSRLPTAELQEELRSLVTAAEDFVQVREDRAFWQLETAGCVRAMLLAAGTELVRDGSLDRPDDVLYLYVDELGGDPGGWRERVAHRRQQLAHWATLLPPPSVGGPSRRGYPVGPDANPEDDDRTLRGTPASPGHVTGPARVIGGLEEADRVVPGDIVVCRATAPTWSPLLAVAAGLVANSGSVLGHTAIVARELGIPAVVAAKDATARIHDGDLLRVDGTTGEVRILERGPKR